LEKRWVYFDPIMSEFMKKIEAIIQSNKVNILIDELNEVVKGFTITEGRGRGSGKRQNIKSERGTISKTAEFNKVSVITTIIDDSAVEKVSKIIEEAVFSGEEGDGIIAISNVESVLNIGTKKKNSEAL
jgi:nitrogen regulatory protein P-II 1